MKIKILIMAILTIGFLAQMQAQTTSPKVTKQQVKQKQRIDQGVKTGQLNSREAKVLRKEQKHIVRKKRQFKKDGKLTGTERAQLNHKQHKAGRHIHRQKHDVQTQ